MSSGSSPISDQSTIEVVQPTVDKILENAYNDVNSLLATLNTDQDISEIEMMQLNVAVSRFNTFITLASGIYKNLCDGEKNIAQKM